MLHELFCLQEYFEEPFSVMYEQDLIDIFGQEAVHGAIDEGLLDHRRIPCGQGRERCVCRLSEKGRNQIVESFF